MTLLQLFDRQITEDGDLSTKVWGPDRSPLREGEEDADTDDYLPIPRAKHIRKGKQSTVYNISEDEDDDCWILDPIDAILISWSQPCVLAKQDAQGTSRKHEDASGSDAPPAKRVKKTVSKPNRLKAMPTTKG